MDQISSVEQSVHFGKMTFSPLIPSLSIQRVMSTQTIQLVFNQAHLDFAHEPLNPAGFWLFGFQRKHNGTHRQSVRVSVRSAELS